MVLWQAQDPRSWNVEGPASGEQYFFPSLARTSDGNFIPAEVLDKLQIIFYSDPVNAAFRALGVD